MIRQNNYNEMLMAVFLLLAVTWTTTAFQPAGIITPQTRSSPLFSTAEDASKPKAKSGYVPKWKKQQTLADEIGDNLTPQDKGIKGTISVVFQQGEETKSTLAMPGQPLRDVATNAGQFIKYGCGKGECGTCEALCDGQWIRPCTAVVPPTVDGDLVVQVKEVASATTSSGQFFSVKSFFMGFYNNVLGMVGFVKYRRNAKKNWEERQEYEALIEKLTLEKRQMRRLAFMKNKEAMAFTKNKKNGGLNP